MDIPAGSPLDLFTDFLTNHINLPNRLVWDDDGKWVMLVIGKYNEGVLMFDQKTGKYLG